MKTNPFACCLLLAACLIAPIGCSDADTGGGGPQAVEENVVQLPPMAGTPTDAGYFVGGVNLLGGIDAGSGEALLPTTKSFPMALRIEVEESAKLLPNEYSVIINKRRYRPKAISFGEKRTTFFSIEKFVADKVELKLGGSDQITTNDAGKLNECSLSTGEVYLLYFVPPSGGTIELSYNGKEYEIRPTEAAALGVELTNSATASTNESQNPSGPQGLEVELKRGQLAIGIIDDKDTELLEVELTLKSSKYETVDLNFGQDFFLAGNSAAGGGGKTGRPPRGRRANRMFVELQEDRMRMLAGTEYFDNTYNDKPMKELTSGGLAISVEPGRPITAFFVFPNPPFENGLLLHFPGKPPIDVVPAGDVLGEIRPAIPRGVAKVPRAPLVGKPVKVNVITGNILVDSEGKSLTAKGPGGGNRFILLKFDISGEREFVPRDYVLLDAAGKNYYPEAAVFGGAPAQAIPGDGYEGIKLMPGAEDVIRKRRGELLYWQYATPEFYVVFSLPESLSTFDFSHGSQLLKITPVTPPIAWKEFRPDEKVAAVTGNDSKPPAETKKKKPETAADDAAKDAAQQVRLGKLLLKKDADKAREYFEEAVRLAPDSPAGMEAKKILEDL